MTIKAGDKIPSVKLATMTDNGPDGVTTEDIFSGKKVVIFGVPGAFTPTCSAKHLPGFVEHAAAIKAKGVDTIACISVNDAFVMGAWGKDQNVGDKVMMLADGSGAFAAATGLELDLVEKGLGKRNQRFSMLVDDGVVKSINIDAGTFEKTSAEQMLGDLG
ncbi:MAG: peroxiredoxin [Rhodospirillales bacterium]|nr:peroxiredoxin [Rhodospirillales bacterium]